MRTNIFLRQYCRLAWIVGLALIAGCASPRSKAPAPITTSTVPIKNDNAADRPAVRLVSNEEPLTMEGEDLSPSVPNEQAGQDPAQVIELRDGQPLALPDAIALAFRRQPRLRVFREGIQQAAAENDLAFVPFLPMVSTGYSVGGFDLNVGGSPVPVGPLPNFTVLPPGFALPVGLNIDSGYELAELKMQWLICDFGRRLGRYNASLLSYDVHQLQTCRAYQTVANEVTVAYYNVLRTNALLRVASESVARDEDELEVAKKLAQGGVIEREKVLREEVKLAESSRLQDLSEEVLGVAYAALDLAIGLQPEESLTVVEPDGLPEFSQTLPDCLQVAVSQRLEFSVAQRTIQIAQEGSRVSKADFAPRIVSGGELLDIQQSSPRGHADAAIGFIKLEWNVFEGGRRVAQQQIADSKIREAMAQADSIADTIAFQVNESYRRMIAARRGIERARPAVTQAKENYRLVRARAENGDATPSEITDAETALTRAQQNHMNSTYDYLSALAKLEFAMGTTPTTSSSASPSGY